MSSVFAMWFTFNFHRDGTRGASLAVRVAFVLLVLGLAWGTLQSTSMVAAQTTPTATNGDTSSELALASALVDALNRGDEDGVVALFDPEATLRADRYAWTRFEIRLWVRAQIAASMAIELEGPYQAVANRAMWTSRVQRADWRDLGVMWVQMANQILVEGGHVMDFTSAPLNGTSVEPLGNLWRPGSTPDRIAPVTPGRDPQRASPEPQVGTLPLAALAAVTVGILLVAGLRGLQPQAVPRGTGSALLAQLDAWRRRRDGSI